jgi:MFS family permease
MGIVGALSTLPDLLIGLPAGAYADRWDRRRMMFVADLGRAVITVAVPLTYWLGGPTMAVILLITFPLNVLRVLWLAAYTAAVPGLVGRPQIARANAIFETFFTVGWIAGPALARLDDRHRRDHVRGLLGRASPGPPSAASGPPRRAAAPPD